MSFCCIAGRESNQRIQASRVRAVILMLMLQTLSLLFLCTLAATAPTCQALSSTPPQRELFSVAPMMAHTNRHYHQYFRHFSRRAHLYTEMIPADAIVHLYNLADGKVESSEALQDLLGTHRSRSSGAAAAARGDGGRDGPMILQLGGRDPRSLALASEIGVRMGYDGVNLNCGCPSNAVSGRAGGCALMRDAGRVAECVERMSESIGRAAGTEGRSEGEVQLSVKHRLGVRDASTYDAALDRRQSDDEAYEECESFVRAITANSNVRKLQVHARLGLLGDFAPERSPETTLWTPDSPSGGGGGGGRATKIDHKREQYKAKKLARQATIHNRSVPPLRPDVVNRLARTFPDLEFVTNGGIRSMEDVQLRLGIDNRAGTNGNNVVGAMVGRAVINHPCSFSRADELLWGEPPSLRRYTREDVLFAHIEYCEREEERCRNRDSNYRELLRRKLVAVPFSLFAGEDGNNAYQRQIRKLGNRPGRRHRASTVLRGALSHVPNEVRRKVVTDTVPLDGIRSYSEYNQRSGPMQRTIL